MSDDADHAAILERIRTVTQAARTTWFTYLATLAFVVVTLLDVEDVDFFAIDRGTELPLIGVSVPAVFFFLFGGLVVTAVYTYLHVVLEQLWHALGLAPPRIGSASLAATMHPWLVAEFALHIRRRLRRDEPPCVEASPLGTFGVTTSAVLLYLAGPLVLAGLWHRSQPAHLGWLTVALGFFLVLALWTCLTSAAVLHGNLRLEPIAAGRRAIWLGLAAATVLAAMLSAISVMRTAWDWRGYAEPRHLEDQSLPFRVAHWFRPAQADLRNAQLVAVPADWLPREEAERRAYARWCARPDTDPCQPALPGGGAFADAWQAERAAYLAALARPVLAGRDLAFADLRGAFLPGVDLEGIHAPQADFAGSELEGVSFREGVLDEAWFNGARLGGANLFLASARGAVFAGTVLVQADLSRARLEGASLNDAILSRAVLRQTRLLDGSLQRADLSRANMNGVWMPGADLIEARLEGALMDRANLSGVRFEGAVLDGSKMFDADFSGANLDRAHLGGAGIYGTDFTGADLTRAYIEGWPDLWAARTDFEDARLVGTALRRLDLSNATIPARRLALTFADGSVTLPEGMDRPCHWSSDVLDDAEFFARWRGVINRLARGDSWSSMPPPVYEKYQDIAPIRPRRDC